jgi:hypothetical protein
VERPGFGGNERFNWVVAKSRLNNMEGTGLIVDVLKDLPLTINGEIFGREDHALRGDDDCGRSFRIRASSAGGSSFLNSRDEALQV